MEKEKWPSNIKGMIDLIFDQLVVFAKYTTSEKPEAGDAQVLSHVKIFHFIICQIIFTLFIFYIG